MSGGGEAVADMIEVQGEQTRCWEGKRGVNWFRYGENGGEEEREKKRKKRRRK